MSIDTLKNKLSYKSLQTHYTWLKGWFGYEKPDIIDQISDLGLIAGGSILSCFKKDIPIKDIDIFVDNQESFVKLLDLINYEFEITFIGVNRSVVEIEIKDNPKIQIIMVKNVNNCFKNFDIDYIKCGYQNRRFVTTIEFDECLKTNTIKRYKPTIKPSRITKAINKGFNVPDELKLISDFFDIPTTEPKYEETTVDKLRQQKLRPLINYQLYTADDYVSLSLDEVKHRKNHVIFYSLCMNIHNGQRKLVKYMNKFKLSFYVTKGSPHYNYIEIKFVNNRMTDLISQKYDFSNLKENDKWIDKLSYNKLYVGEFYFVVYEGKVSPHVTKIIDEQEHNFELDMTINESKEKCKYRNISINYLVDEKEHFFRHNLQFYIRHIDDTNCEVEFYQNGVIDMITQKYGSLKTDYVLSSKTCKNMKDLKMDKLYDGNFIFYVYTNNNIKYVKARLENVNNVEELILINPIKHFKYNEKLVKNFNKYTMSSLNLEINNQFFKTFKLTYKVVKRLDKNTLKIKYDELPITKYINDNVGKIQPFISYQELVVGQCYESSINFYKVKCNSETFIDSLKTNNTEFYEKYCGNNYWVRIHFMNYERIL